MWTPQYLNASCSVNEHATSTVSSIVKGGDACQGCIGHALHGHAAPKSPNIACEVGTTNLQA